MFQFIMSQVGPEQVLLFKAVRAKHPYKASHAAWCEHKPFTFCPNMYAEFARTGCSKLLPSTQSHWAGLSHSVALQLNISLVWIHVID